MQEGREGMEGSPAKAFEPESPKKKRKISRSRLLQTATPTEGYISIGKLYRHALRKKAIEEEGISPTSNPVPAIGTLDPESGSSGARKSEGEPNEALKIEKGSLKAFKLRCVVTDNRNGRELPREIERTFRFVNISDATGTISLGMKEADAEAFGITAFDLDMKDRSETAYSFFNAEISGSVTWIQSSKEKVGIPTFYLNNASVKEIKEMKWNRNTNLVFPTADVCRLMVTGRYALSNRFVSTGICGQIDEVECKNAKTVMMSLEDPVGYVAVELRIDGHMLNTDAKSYIAGKHLEVGKAVFLGGKLPLSVMDNSDNAIIQTITSDAKIEIIEQPEFLLYVNKLCNMDAKEFMGIAPEKMDNVE